ncbi:hypothetical protein DPMN_123558 [Dreissena polymorpha]|uniref:Integrase zinc-binding domain-containing protein n=1 Tax=Dreissena polymorpha TaxID=45954 RepID=A0A9D4GUH7_DREPO|nr:hypothetical protein DPMN_123558 [Dreissena polymorpha]
MRFVLRWLKTKTDPVEGELLIASQEAKSYWINNETFQLVGNVLFKITKNSRIQLLVFSGSLREVAMQLHHDIPSFGHQGVARTKAMLKEKFYL